MISLCKPEYLHVLLLAGNCLKECSTNFKTSTFKLQTLKLLQSVKVHDERNLFLTEYIWFWFKICQLYKLRNLSEKKINLFLTKSCLRRHILMFAAAGHVQQLYRLMWTVSNIWPLHCVKSLHFRSAKAKFARCCVKREPCLQAR